MRQALHRSRSGPRGKGLTEFTPRVLRWVAEQEHRDGAADPLVRPYLGLACGDGKCEP